MAYAHIRGGGDLGKPWHDAGKMLVKRNTFTDFIACVEHLTAAGYGDPTRVAAEGGSAGGLLMGAVVNMRPDLFRAIVSHVPFVDVMNTMLDASLPLTVPEYEEWGDPNQEEYFRYMLSYSPYDNLRAASYPAMLVKTVLHDSQVGLPDLLDELKYQLDWLVKMQAADGGVYVKMGSIDYNGANSKRYYGPECTGATIASAMNYAHAARVYGKFPRWNHTLIWYSVDREQFHSRKEESNGNIT